MGEHRRSVSGGPMVMRWIPLCLAVVGVACRPGPGMRLCDSPETSEKTLEDPTAVGMTGQEILDIAGGEREELVAWLRDGG